MPSRMWVAALALVGCGGGRRDADLPVGGGGSDRDGDGFAVPDDCDDADPQVFPGAEDPPYDGVDGDCAGDDDFDADRDGVPRDGDCDDADPLRFPGNTELLCDQLDGDCDGEVERAENCVLGSADAEFQLDTEGAPGRLAPDLTGDGRPDLVGLVGVDYEPGHGGSSTTELEVWAQDGAGVVLAATVRSTGVSATDYFSRKGVQSVSPTEDADGDGVVDLWVTAYGGAAWLLAGPLSGDIDLEAEAVATEAAFPLPPEDIDGDGYGDVYGWDEVRFGPWTESGPARTLPLEALPEAAIDLDGSRAIVGIVDGGFGALDAETGVLLAAWAGQFYYPMVAADTNGDGYEDFGFVGTVYFGPIVDGERPDPSVVLDDQQDRNFEPGAAGDVDADGAAEIALVESTAIYIVHANTPGTFQIADVSYILPEGTLSIGPWSGARPMVAVATYEPDVYLFGLSSWPLE